MLCLSPKRGDEQAGVLPGSSAAGQTGILRAAELHLGAMRGCEDSGPGSRSSLDASVSLRTSRENYLPQTRPTRDFRKRELGQRFSEKPAPAVCIPSGSDWVTAGRVAGCTCCCVQQRGPVSHHCAPSVTATVRVTPVQGQVVKQPHTMKSSARQ